MAPSPILVGRRLLPALPKGTRAFFWYVQRPFQRPLGVDVMLDPLIWSQVMTEIAVVATFVAKPGNEEKVT